MSKIIFGIDLGNKQTKLYDGTHTYVMPSSLLPASKVEGGFSLGKSDNMTKFETKIAKGGSWYWGQGILTYSKDELTDSLMHDNKRYSSRPYQNLCELSLGQLGRNYVEAKDGVLTVDYVIAGLPSDDWEAKGDANVNEVKKNFIGKHLINVDGESLTIDVKDCLVLSQSFGTLLSIVFDGATFDGKENTFTKEQLALSQTIQEGTIGVVDIGGGTVLLDTLKNHNRSSQNHNQYKVGANTLYENIANAVGTEHNFTADVQTVELALRDGLEDGEFAYKRSALNVYDMTDIVNQQIDDWSYDLVDKIRHTFSNLGDMDLLLITGGGSELVNKEIIEEEFDGSVHVKFVENPEVANVKGFYYQGQILSISAE